MKTGSNAAPVKQAGRARQQARCDAPEDTQRYWYDGFSKVWNVHIAPFNCDVANGNEAESFKK